MAGARGPQQTLNVRWTTVRRLLWRGLKGGTQALGLRGPLPGRSQGVEKAGEGQWVGLREAEFVMPLDAQQTRGAGAELARHCLEG